MDNINALEELGLQEVSRKTHIEVRFLEYMINKDFDKLNRINTLGFAKILKREYDLDLDSWIEEFNAYWQENRQTNVKESAASLLAQKNTSKKPSYVWAYILLILIAIGLFLWFFDGLKYFSSSTPNQPVTSTEQTTEPTKPEVPVENELKEPMENIDDVKIADINETNQTKVTITDDNATDKNTTVEDENTTKEQNNMEEERVAQEAYLQPRRKIWVGLVDLETRKKSQYATNKVITINLNKPQIIITGHGNFTLNYDNGKEINPKNKRKQYYYVDGGTMTEINRKEFIAYNGGKPW